MSISHEKYTLVIVDEYSSQTNNGTEFRNQELESFCDEKGISQNFSSPYTPEQNSVPKRKNSTLIEAARTMMNGLDTPLSLKLYEYLTLEDNRLRKLIKLPLMRSPIIHHASTSSNPAPQDRWSRDQHIKLVNIIGEPTEGMLVRSMAAKLTAASASECLFANFLFKVKPKKVSEALKHLGWVDAM
ncbi:retrovirus-related pol polyprotein from transposon TNT 1-94 [Tanacetum coccineum]